MPPASLKFREYYRYGLKDAMLEETYRFVSNAVDENVPVTDFIQSDYTFINQDLARHYKMEGIEGIHFRKVSLPSESMRGGLLGQASILTLTANGVDTSPVIRGIWVLESLLGTPPHHLHLMSNRSIRCTRSQNHERAPGKTPVCSSLCGLSCKN